MHTATLAGRMARPMILVAALAGLALALAFAVRPAQAGGAAIDIHQDLPIDSETFNATDDCGDFTSGVVWHFIFNGYSGSDDPHLYATFAEAGALDAPVFAHTGGAYHFYLNTPGEDSLTAAYVQVELEEGQLQLSHVCRFEEEESPTPTPEGSQFGGTSTPEASVGDGAFGVTGVSPIPTAVFSLILLASLGSLAYANVRSARSRS